MTHTTKAALIGLVLTATAAHAATIELDFDKTNYTSSGATVVKDSDGTSSSGGNDAIVQYTISGLTLDSFGSGDDSITVAFQLSGPIDTLGFGASSGNWGVHTTTTAADNSSLVDSDTNAGYEFITLSNTSATVSLGAGGTQTADVSFTGFTGFNISKANNDPDVTEKYGLSGTSIDGTGKSGYGNKSFDPTASFTLTQNTGAFRLGGIDATFETTVIPEPSSSALLGLGGLALIMRRRK